MADSRIEEVQAKVTELQTQYEKVLSELDAAIAAYAGENSAENASKLATAQKAEEEAKNELEGAKQQVEMVKQDVLVEAVEAELDKAEIDLASKNFELENAEEAAKEFNIPTFLRTPRTEKPLREYRKEAMEAEAIKDLWEAQSEVVKAAQETLNAEIAAHINDESYTPQTSETQAVDAAREAEKRAKELLDEAKRKYQKLTGKDYPIDEIISQALGDIEPQRGVGNEANQDKDTTTAPAEGYFAEYVKEIGEYGKKAEQNAEIVRPSFLENQQENNIEIPEDTSKREWDKMLAREKQGPKVENPEVEAPKVEVPEVENPEIKAKRAELDGAKKLYVEALKGVGQAKRDLAQAEKELVELKSNLEHKRGKPYVENQFLWAEETKQEFQNANNKIEAAKEKIKNAKDIVRSSKTVLDQIGFELATLKGLNLKPRVEQKGTPSFLKDRVDTIVGEGNAKNTDEPGKTPSSENESKSPKQEEGPEVPPFMNKNPKRRSRVTPIKHKRRRRWRAGWTIRSR